MCIFCMTYNRNHFYVHILHVLPMYHYTVLLYEYYVRVQGEGDDKERGIY